jgi:hypothetical protein
MRWFRRSRYDPYPLSPYGLAQKREEENEHIKALAVAIYTRNHFARLGLPGGRLLDPLTPEQKVLLQRAREDEGKVLFKPIPMRQGWAHKRMYGTRKHRFVGHGPFMFLIRECVCGKTKVT